LYKKASQNKTENVYSENQDNIVQTKL